MTLSELIVKALGDLKGKGHKGISRQAIKKAVGAGHSAAQLNLALKRLVKSKAVTQTKGSFKLSAAAPKKAKKTVKKAAKAAKADKPKKAAATKKVAKKAGTKKAAAAKPKKAAGAKKAAA